MGWFTHLPNDEGLIFAIILSHVVAVAILCQLIHIVSGYLLRRLYPESFEVLNNTDQRTTQAECTSFLLTLFLVPFFIAGAVEVSGSIDERWNGISHNAYVAIILTFGLTLYEEVMYMRFGRELIFHFHHCLVIVMFSVILYYPHLLFYVCWAATVETTGLCVNYFFIDKKLHPNGPPNITAGVLMWLSFLVFRLLSLPALLIVAAIDIVSRPSIATEQSLAYLLLNAFSAVCVVSMSAMWFVKMTRGILKVLNTTGGRAVAPEPAAIVAIVTVVATTAATTANNVVSNIADGCKNSDDAVECNPNPNPNTVTTEEMRESPATEGNDQYTDIELGKIKGDLDKVSKQKQQPEQQESNGRSMSHTATATVGSVPVSILLPVPDIL